MLPLPDATTASFSPDGTHFAYVPNSQWEWYWQGYRGGQTTPIWIANLADSSVIPIPRNNSNDRFPMWIGHEIYFFPIAADTFTLYAYDPQTRASTQLIENPHGFDIVSASANNGEIVYSKFDSIHLYRSVVAHRSRSANDNCRRHARFASAVGSGRESNSECRDLADRRARGFRSARRHPHRPGRKRSTFAISHRRPGIMERDPAWSPDGKWIAYFSDACGEYTLRLRDQKACCPSASITLEPNPSFYYSPTWSPDSKKIAYSDKHSAICTTSTKRKSIRKAVKFAQQRLRGFRPEHVRRGHGRRTADILPISRGTHELHPRDLHLRYAGRPSAPDHRRHERCYQPAFDKNPESTCTSLRAPIPASPSTGSTWRATSARPRAACMQRPAKSDASPVAPQSDDEPVTSDEPVSGPPAASTTPKPATRPTAATSKMPAIDFDEIGQRIVSLADSLGELRRRRVGNGGHDLPRRRRRW